MGLIEKEQAIQVTQRHCGLCAREIQTIQEKEAPSPTWISVQDRIPEKEGSTLICTDNGSVCTARFYPNGGAWNGSCGKRVKYWMPLPEPPKEE